MLQQRYDIGKTFMERQYVRIRGVDELAVHTVEQRVRRLMRNDVLRQAREHRAAR